MSEERYLTFALAKGRLANKTMELLEKIGITCEEMKDKDSRKLIFVNEEKKLKFFLAKGPDVPTYVEYGAADIGVVGRDTIMEENRHANASDHITFVLKNPKAADDLFDEAELKLNALSSFPNNFPLVDDPLLASWGIRFTQVKHYLAFYVISEKDHKVTVIRFLYEKSNWSFILKHGFSHF